MTTEFDPTTGETPEPRPSMIDLVAQTVTQARDLVYAEIELVKLKAKKAAKKIGVGAALVAVGAFFAIYLLFWIFHSIELLLALVVPAWAAALITTGIILLLLVGFLALGASLIKRGSSDGPDVSGEISANVDSIKEGLGK